MQKSDPQIREERKKDLKMKDQKCIYNKGEHWQSKLERYIFVGRKARGKWRSDYGITCPDTEKWPVSSTPDK